MDFKRRSIISAAGSVIGLATAIPTAGAVRDQNTFTDLPQSFRREIIEIYGKKEGKELLKLVDKQYKAVEKGKIERDELHDNVTDQVLNSEKLPTVKEDIIENWERKPPQHQISEATWSITENTEIINEISDSEIAVDKRNDRWYPSSAKGRPRNDANSKDVSIAEVTSSNLVTSSSVSREERFVFSEADRNTTGASRAAATVDDTVRYTVTRSNGQMVMYSNDAHLRARASSYVYGSAWSYARGYTSVSLPTSGTYALSTQYLLNGNADTGTTEISLFARRHSDGALNPEKIENPVTVQSEERSRYADFELDADETYDLGVELYCRTSASGSANSSNYYSSGGSYGRRGVRVRDPDENRVSLRIDLK